MQNEYKKEVPDLREQYKGYQTMDAQAHPVVQRSQKIKDILSDVSVHFG